jgi:DNA polymerase-1
VRYLFELQRRFLEEFREKKRQYDRDQEDYQQRKRDARRRKETLDEDPPDEPKARRLVCSDTTIEKLAQILEDNPDGILVARDELAGWLGSFSRYKGKSGGSDLPNWLEMYYAGNVVVDRKTGDRPTLFISRAAVSVCGTIQPGALVRALTPEFLEAGLAARLLMAMPPKRKKAWTEQEVAPEVEDAYKQLLDKLQRLEPDIDQEADNDRVPFAVKLSPEAKEAWVQFYNEWAEVQAGSEGETAAAYSKLEGAAARLALLHHLVGQVSGGEDDCDPVGKESIDAGVELCRWFARESRRIYSILSESREETEARRLVEFIRARGGRITVKELQRSNSRKYPTAALAEAALNSLVQAGLARWQDRPVSPQGGRPTRECVILEQAPDDTDETPPEHPPDDDGGPTKPADETSAGAAETPTNSGNGGVSSESSGAFSEKREREGAGESPQGFVGRSAAVSSDGSPPSYQLVTEQRDLAPVRWALDESGEVGVDIETTGLDPRRDKVRLLSLATERGTFIIDAFRVDVRALFDHLTEKPLVVHNGAFDLAFLTRLGLSPGAIHDTMLLSQLLYAGKHCPHKLGDCAGRELGRALNKELQRSDWSGEPTEEQLAYAALDAAVLPALRQSLTAKLTAVGLDRVAEIESRCLPALVWLAQHGVPFDRDTWDRLARQAETDVSELTAKLDAAAGRREGYLGEQGVWDWNSPAQVKQALAAVGCPVEDTTDEALAAVDHPLAALVRDYRHAMKRQTTYGRDWLQHVAPDGRVYAHWVQLGSRAGRMSCREPNMQQIPRGDHRRCVCPPEGKVLVKADYSQVELRIAALVANEERMVEAFRRRQDLHALTAKRVLGVKDVSKSQRQLAKAVNFGLLYGMGAKGFQVYARSNYGVEMTVDEATSYRSAFFEAYPGLKRWHRSQPDGEVETRTLTGRRRLGVNRFTEKLNTPVQGTGADGLKLALALLWERRGDCPAAVPVLAVHDEIVVEADRDQAEAAAAWLKTAMLDAMAPLIDPVPVEVEVKVSHTWGG